MSICKTEEKSVSFGERRDVKIIDYYAFESLILMRLNDIFSLKNIERHQENEEVTKTVRDEFGKLHNIVVGKIVYEDSIRLNFSNDFHVEFSKDSLIQAYEEKCGIEDVTRRLRKYIESQWLKRIYRENTCLLRKLRRDTPDIREL